MSVGVSVGVGGDVVGVEGVDKRGDNTGEEGCDVGVCDLREELAVCKKEVSSLRAGVLGGANDSTG